MEKIQDGDRQIRIGLVGSDQGMCAGRGSGAVLNVFSIEPDARLIAIADFLSDNVELTRNCIADTSMAPKPSGADCPVDRCFSGFNAYKKLLEMQEINYVILLPPPHFRPAYLRAAIEAGKHVFVEPPVAVDASGVRSVLASGELARQKNLGIAVGFVRRHQISFIETIRRIHNGDIGRIVECRSKRNTGTRYSHPRKPEHSDMEWQLRNYLWFNWLSGDAMLMDHVHELDVINWVMQSHPLRAYGLGGKQIQSDSIFGNVYDHFAVEYEYPDGVTLFSQCRHIDHCYQEISQSVKSATGWSNCMGKISGKNEWHWSGKIPNPYTQEHAAFIASLRSGKPLNDAQAAAESTLTAIMGREAAYSGKTIEWAAAMNSKQDLSPSAYEWGPMPAGEVPMPGKYRFV